jgi:septal ring factor EnvC (AmiA/AmiB activator)
MRLPLTFLAFLTVCALPLGAQTPSDRLGAVADDLDQIVADLETGQNKAAELRKRLADLETLTAEHQAALRDQERLLADYQASVAALEAHDRSTLDQLAAERAVTGWLLQAAGVAVALAVVEGLVLAWR